MCIIQLLCIIDPLQWAGLKSISLRAAILVHNWQKVLQQDGDLWKNGKLWFFPVPSSVTNSRAKTNTVTMDDEHQKKGHNT